MKSAGLQVVESPPEMVKRVRRRRPIAHPPQARAGGLHARVPHEGREAARRLPRRQEVAQRERRAPRAAKRGASSRCARPSSQPHHVPATWPAPIRALAALSRVLAVVEGVGIGVCLLAVVGLATWQFVERNLTQRARCRSSTCRRGPTASSATRCSCSASSAAPTPPTPGATSASTRSRACSRPKQRMVLRVVHHAGGDRRRRPVRQGGAAASTGSRCEEAGEASQAEAAVHAGARRDDHRRRLRGHRLPLLRAGGASTSAGWCRKADAAGGVDRRGGARRRAAGGRFAVARRTIPRARRETLRARRRRRDARSRRTDHDAADLVDRRPGHPRAAALLRARRHRPDRPAPRRTTPLSGALADVYALAGGKAVSLSTIPLFTFAGYLMARAKTARAPGAHGRGAARLDPRRPGAHDACGPAPSSPSSPAPRASPSSRSAACSCRSWSSSRYSQALLARGGHRLGRRRPALPAGAAADRLRHRLRRSTPATPASNRSSSPSSASSSPASCPGLVLLGILSIYCVVEGWRSKVPRYAARPARVLRARCGRRSGSCRSRSSSSACSRSASPSSPRSAALTALYVFVIEVFVYKDIDIKRDLFARHARVDDAGRRDLHEDRRRRPS